MSLEVEREVKETKKADAHCMKIHLLMAPKGVENTIFWLHFVIFYKAFNKIQNM